MTKIRDRRLLAGRRINGLIRNLPYWALTLPKT